MNRYEAKSAVEKAAKGATQYLRQTNLREPIKAWFPSGVIRTLGNLKGRWPYLSRDRRRTCACVVQLCDVNRWFMNVYNVSLTAGTMLAWQCTLPVIALIETLLYEVGRQEGWVDEDARFKKCINVLNSKGVYGERFKEQLHELRDFRNDIHLHIRKNEVEMYDGKPKSYNVAVVVLHQLEKYLNEYFEKKG